MKSFAFRPREYYKIARAEIEHEDELINNRVTWFIYLQTILFAAFFLVGTNAKDTVHWQQFSRLIYAIAFGSCLHSFAGIYLARKAIKQLRRQFYDQVYANEEDPERYPDPVVNKHGNKRALILALSVPVLFALAWIYVVIFLRNPFT